MINWIKSLFNRLVRAFKEFLKIALPVAKQLILAELKDFAISVVDKLQSSKLSNTEKRKEAFKQIEEEAKNRGKSVSSSLINVLIELALQYIKNQF